jgi:hypothetical protein
MLSFWGISQGHRREVGFKGIPSGAGIIAERDISLFS